MELRGNIAFVTGASRSIREGIELKGFPSLPDERLARFRAMIDEAFHRPRRLT